MQKLVTTVVLLGFGSSVDVASADGSGSIAYVLQAEKFRDRRSKAIKALTKSKRDMIILDKSFDGSHRKRWRKKELDGIRAGKSGRKLIAYVSVSEAETYRRYWKTKWDRKKDGKPDKGAPGWLCTENPDWEGNYKVKYWQDGWQKITLDYVSGLVKQGFDGIWLDGVDGFEFFEEVDGDYVDNRKNPVTKNTYRRDMINWVIKLAAHARKAAGGSFDVFVQNGGQLLASKSYRKTITAYVQEDLFTHGERKQKVKESKFLLKYIKWTKKSKKPVILIEYPIGDEIKKYAIQQAKKTGYPMLLTDRNLTTLGLWYR